MNRRVIGYLVVCTVVGIFALAGGSGVPASSAPEVIRPVTGGVAPSAASSITPPAGADPREIVAGFLAANVSEDAHHTGARSFLTASSAKSWADTTAALVNDDFLGLPDPVNDSVTVTADTLGTLDQRGIYTPVTQGTGTTPYTVTFGMQKVDGQWRISTLANGLIVTEAEFLATYRARPVYFFDQSQKRLG